MIFTHSQLAELQFFLMTSTPWKFQVTHIVRARFKKKVTKQQIHTWISSTIAKPAWRWWDLSGLQVQAVPLDLWSHAHRGLKHTLKSYPWRHGENRPPSLRPWRLPARAEPTGGQTLTVAVPWPMPGGGSPGLVFQHHARVQRGMLCPACCHRLVLWLAPAPHVRRWWRMRRDRAQPRWMLSHGKSTSTTQSRRRRQVATSLGRSPLLALHDGAEVLVGCRWHVHIGRGGRGRSRHPCRRLRSARSPPKPFEAPTQRPRRAVVKNLFFHHHHHGKRWRRSRERRWWMSWGDARTSRGGIWSFGHGELLSSGDIRYAKLEESKLSFDGTRIGWTILVEYVPPKRYC
jgi:hypothetical protein